MVRPAVELEFEALVREHPPLHLRPKSRLRRLASETRLRAQSRGEAFINSVMKNRIYD